MDSEISTFLDRIGFSQEEIRWRQKMWKYVDILDNIKNRIAGRGNVKAYHSGSRPEGTGINAIVADIDVMYSVPKYRVIHDYKEWEYLPGVTTLLIDTTGLHPGYCRLLVMYKDAPILLEARYLPYISSTLNLVAHNGVIVVSNNFEVKPTYVRKGPAHTMDIAWTTGGMDHVVCIPTAFPAEAREWVDRYRPSNFQPQEFLHKSVRRDIFVVGTGYKKNENPILEWRFSFSLIELEIVLMWANNVTRCYVLLKMLKKHISSLSPHLSNIISSYHLKTLLFWSTEQTGLQFWERSSVVKCLMFSLERLLLWVERGHIPHYFIKDNNMFDLHMGATRQRDVAAVLCDMITQGPACILRSECYKILSSGISSACVDCRSLHVQEERVFLHNVFVGCLTICIKYSSDHHKSMGSLCNALDIVQAAIPLYDSDVEKCLGYMRAELRCTLATSVLSMSLQNRMSNVTRHLVFKISEQLLKGSIHKQVGQLKLANFYYQTRQYKLATNVLQVLVEMDLSSLIRFDFRHGDYHWQNRHLDVHALAITESPAEVLSNMTSVSLLFELPEIHASPYALKFEMFKPQLGLSGEDSVSKYLDKCSVDPLAFVFYLQYTCMCYEKMGKKKHAEVAFDNLLWVAKQECRIHRDTTWNILGHCYYKQGKLRQAVSCLVESLRIQPFRSVALVQLALVLNSAFAQNGV